MPEAIGLVYCSVHQVYILPEDSADSDPPGFRCIRERANRFFVRTSC